MNITRRGLIIGLLAAPIIVRAGILMPVRAFKPDALTIDEFARRYIEPAMRKLEAQLRADADVWARELWSTPTVRGGLGELIYRPAQIDTRFTFGAA